MEVTDADGTMWTLTTNAAGKFYIPPGDGPVVMPYQAQITLADLTLQMTATQSDKSCASCHTQTGANDAIGRIYIPVPD